jgi:hypothetical protein
LGKIDSDNGQENGQVNLPEDELVKIILGFNFDQINNHQPTGAIFQHHQSASAAHQVRLRSGVLRRKFKSFQNFLLIVNHMFGDQRSLRNSDYYEILKHQTENLEIILWLLKNMKLVDFWCATNLKKHFSTSLKLSKESLKTIEQTYQRSTDDDRDRTRSYSYYMLTSSIHSCNDDVDEIMLKLLIRRVDLDKIFSISNNFYKVEDREIRLQNSLTNCKNLLQFLKKSLYQFISVVPIVDIILRF